MNAVTTTQAQEVGRYLAELLADDPVAQRLWVRPHRDYVEIWLLTTALDVEAEREMYRYGPLLYDHFPDTYLRYYPINPVNYEGDPLWEVPADAIELPLNAP